ncbi:MAG: diguanylate cyclase response regulator [Deltaproteobacteria bacterium RIFOXYD12_FULL_50_9]|nr:MAG: diguanylate cyclase response regulator [Deltaproteobacteria bacterium RIFOXYD12_FULL_50_9]
MPRILFAGNSELLTGQTRLLLEGEGIELIAQTRLAQAVSQILEDPPDFLIVESGFDGKGDVELIRTAKSCLQKTNMPIFLIAPEPLAIRLDWQQYPVDDIIVPPFSSAILLARISLAEARMNRVFDNNPLSKLPGNTSILRAIQKTIISQEGYGICYLDLDNFKPYNDHYGFFRGDEVLIMTARLIVNVVDEYGREGSFVGHVGGDDFVFIVREERIKAVCEKLLGNFETVKNMFIDKADIAAGGIFGKDRQGRKERFDLLSISIAVVVNSSTRKFKHYGEVSEAASQLKSYVKSLMGSNYVIDRRN